MDNSQHNIIFRNNRGRFVLENGSSKHATYKQEICSVHTSHLILQRTKRITTGVQLIPFIMSVNAIFRARCRDFEDSTQKISLILGIITKKSQAMKRKQKKRNLRQFYLTISLIISCLSGNSCKICANARKNKKDTQEWKPLKCLISKLLRFVAGPGIEPWTS